MRGMPEQGLINEKMSIELDNKPSTSGKVAASVREAVEAYFADMDGHHSNDLYHMLISEVEQPMLEVVLRYVRGNQSRASEILGINRGTLRKKMKIYGLD